MTCVVLIQDEQVAMEACEFWWVLMESIEGCSFVVEQHMSTVSPSTSQATPHNSPVDGYDRPVSASARRSSGGERSFLAELIPGLISRLPLSEAQVMQWPSIMICVSVW